MDKPVVFGLLVGLLAIVLGQALEGGHLRDIIQGTAAFIVLGGTVGAVLVSSTQQDIKLGLRLFTDLFKAKSLSQSDEIINQVVAAATIARSESLVALEKKITHYDPFLKSVLRMMVDGVDSHTIREIAETRISSEEEQLLSGAKIWTDAGGYAPTIGILGAVLGLIHVMGNLSDTSKLGAGIAVAFVATIYGVGLANLAFLPIGTKIKKNVQRHVRIQEMALEGALAILQGMSPHLIKEKMYSYLVEPD